VPKPALIAGLGAYDFAAYYGGSLTNYQPGLQITSGSFCSLQISEQNELGGIKMTKINLRDIYPWYTKDEFIEISDDAATVIFEDLRRENAYRRKMYRHKANYAIDWQAEAEFEIDDKNISPLEIMIEKLDKQLLYAAIAKLTDKQAKRLYAFFFLDMNIDDIARAEGVSKQSVYESLTSAAKKLKKSLSKTY
jgi:RNA polymerase sigma-70 factor (ECF subfamily)